MTEHQAENLTREQAIDWLCERFDMDRLSRDAEWTETMIEILMTRGRARHSVP